MRSVCSGWWRSCCSSSRSASPTSTCGGAAGWIGTEMGLEEHLPSGVLLTSVEKLVNWTRKSSLWPATFGLACCAIEMNNTGTPGSSAERKGAHEAELRDGGARDAKGGQVEQSSAPVDAPTAAESEQ